jgi:branched-chain amino acid transport system substrate-binding protein
MISVVKALLTLVCFAASSLASAQAVPGVTDKTIKIGMFGPLTGSLSTWGYPVLNGTSMVYKEVNAKGGIHGRMIEFIEEDDACDPAKAVAAAKKLIHRDRVFMINAGVCSGAVMATRDEMIANKVPLMVLVASLHSITEPLSPYIFTVSPTGVHDGKTMGEFATSIPNAKTVAFIGHSDEWAKTKVDAFKAVAAGKLKIVAEEIIDRRVTDATSQVLAIKRRNPDVVALMTYPGETATFLRDAHKYGLKAKFIGNNALIDLPALVERAGNAEAVQDVYVMASLSGPVESKALEPFEAMLKRHYPNDKPKAESFWGTASALVVVEALRRAGRDLTREKFISALEQIRDLETGIAPCKITLSPDNHQGCQAQMAWKLSKGRPVAVGLKWREVD